MKYKFFSLSLFFQLNVISVFCQSGEVYVYARKIVDTMASAAMHGRGYVYAGDSIAAEYLAKEFQSMRLSAFQKDYFQPFRFPVNTFPGIISVNLEDNTLVPGTDFLVSASSSSVAGTFNVVMADDALVEQKKKFRKFLKQDLRNKILVVNDTGTQSTTLQELLSNTVNAKAIIVLKDKLTWSVAQQASGLAMIELLRSSYTFPKEIRLGIENKFIPDYQSQNVVGYIKGSEFPDSFIVFSAHYDHLGHMGKFAYFPGANDNASGCAMLLNLAKHYSIPANKPKYSIAFIAFAAEEVGLLGSKYYTEHPLFPLKNIKFLLNMDIMGTGEEGITAVNGSVFKEQFELLKKINTDNHFIKDVKIRGKAANSDHYFFSENGVPAFFIYTMGGIKAYHDIYDRPETLPLNEFENLFKLITNFTNQLQSPVNSRTHR